jgi:hypothetical protein
MIKLQKKKFCNSQGHKIQPAQTVNKAFYPIPATEVEKITRCIICSLSVLWAVIKTNRTAQGYLHIKGKTCLTW